MGDGYLGSSPITACCLCTTDIIGKKSPATKFWPSSLTALKTSHLFALLVLGGRLWAPTGGNEQGVVVVKLGERKSDTLCFCQDIMRHTRRSIYCLPLCHFTQDSYYSYLHVSSPFCFRTPRCRSCRADIVKSILVLCLDRMLHMTNVLSKWMNSKSVGFYYFSTEKLFALHRRWAELRVNRRPAFAVSLT